MSAVNDFHAKLETLKETINKLSPGFRKWFYKKRELLFEKNAIKTARVKPDVEGLFYKNGIKSQYFWKKLEKCYKKESNDDAICQQMIKLK